jgi:hypothetical protein
MDGYLGGSGRGTYKTHSAGVTKELRRVTWSRFESDTQEYKLDTRISLFQPAGGWLVTHTHTHTQARTNRCRDEGLDCTNWNNGRTDGLDTG